MLIITADDYGKNTDATDSSVLVYKNGRITSLSAMVFMKDSQRAAEKVSEIGAESGLHLNFSQPFDGDVCSEKLLNYQNQISAFLENNRFASIFYNPFLKKEFEYVYMAQYEEYVRLYGAAPTHINGHRHMHLCSNILIDGLIARGSKVRRTFTFDWGEKNILNIIYRRLLDRIIVNRYVCTNSFYSLMPIENKERLQKIIYHSTHSAVELMVHPEIEKELDYLMSNEFIKKISEVVTGTFEMLKKKRRKT
jgi:predicted glycoside hydrolase/deacetylase ChbG (UPF0249 family)